jgi:hypothetical protein
VKISGYIRLGQPAVFGPRAGAVRGIVPSPDGQFLVLIRGEARTMYSPALTGADLFRRQGESFQLVGALPEFSERLFVLDGGLCVVVKSSGSEVGFVRYSASKDGVREEARGMWVQAEGLCEPTALLLAPGHEAIVGASSRDDGQGWSEPVYTDYWLRVDLRSGAIREESGGPLGLPPHGLPGAGVPWAAEHDGGDAAAVAKIIKALPFRREWARRVGRSRLQTSARIIDVATGATLIGEESSGPLRVRRVFHDLSPEESLALATDPQGCFELWDVGQAAFASLPLPEHGETRCAAFLRDGAMVLGMSSGEGVVVGVGRVG